MVFGKWPCSTGERTASIMPGFGVRRRRLLHGHTTTQTGCVKLGNALERPIISRMLIRRAPDLRFSDITPKSLYLRRREFLQTAAGAAIGAAAMAVASPLAANVAAQQGQGTGHGAKLANVKKSPLSTTGEKVTSWDDITSYNNFYEFGPYKEDPKANAWHLKPRPWTITVE